MNTYKDLNEAFTESLKDLDNDYLLVNSRGTLQKERLWYSLLIKDPTALSIEVPARKFKPEYAVTEWLWYLSEDPDVKNIGKLASIWKNIADENNKVESNYGLWLHGITNEKTGLNQWDWVVNELVSDKDTRRASITINSPHHKGKNNKDYPCTQYIHFFIRGNKLHMGVNMRSNDAVFGFCNDVFTFCMYQQLMLNELNSKLRSRHLNSESKKIELGQYYHSAGSFHVYETHFKMMNKIVQNYGKKHTPNGSYTEIPYPDLKKFKLRDTITLKFMKNVLGTLPSKDMSKSEIQIWAKEKMELLYV
tara:strand:- start:302 stop:1219 length:918 start_codon:yes stop_codon:yes gene_type:complete